MVTGELTCGLTSGLSSGFTSGTCVEVNRCVSSRVVLICVSLLAGKMRQVKKSEKEIE